MPEFFEKFIGSVAMADVIATAEQVLGSARVPGTIRDETLTRLRARKLTTSHQKLIFNYKLAFETMRANL